MARPQQQPNPLDQQSEVHRTRLRVCYFTHSGSTGGAPLSLLYLIQQMDRDRYEPIVVFLFDSSMRQTFQEHGIDTMVASGMTYFSHTTGESLSPRNPRGWLQVLMFLPSVVRTYRLVRRLRPAIVHLNSSTLAPQVIGAKLAGAKVIWHIREHILDGLVGLRRELLKIVARHFADALITIMEDEVQRLGSPEKTRLIYNFVDFTYFDRHLRDDVLAKEHQRTRTVAMLGGISNIKGTLELVQAWPLVRERVGPVQLVVAGSGGNDGPDSGSWLRRWLRRALGRDNYVRQVRAYVHDHCAEGVEFAGVVEDVPSLLAETDLVVFPSTEPHFARPVIEAGAMAIPVVASDIPGPRELVKHGETGLLVPPGDPKALADAIARILSDEGAARSMGEQGYAQATRLFNAQSNSRATFGIYEQLLQGGLLPTSSQDPGNGGANTESGEQQRRVSHLWTMLFLAWLVLLFGAYFAKILTFGGRWERIQEMFGRMFG